MHVLRERGVIRRVVSNHKTHFVSENNYHTETSVTITGLLIGCGIFKGNYAAGKVYYAADYAIFLKLI